MLCSSQDVDNLSASANNANPDPAIVIATTVPQDAEMALTGLSDRIDVEVVTERGLESEEEERDQKLTPRAPHSWSENTVSRRSTLFNVLGLMAEEQHSASASEPAGTLTPVRGLRAQSSARKRASMSVVDRMHMHRDEI